MENGPRRSKRLALRLNESNTHTGNWSLPLYTSRPLCATGDLCVTCEECFKFMLYPPRLDFRAQEDWERHVKDIPPVGWLDRILATKSCALCRFFAEIVQIEYKFNLDMFNAHNRVYCTIGASNRFHTSSTRLLRATGHFWLQLTEVVIETGDGRVNSRACLLGGVVSGVVGASFKLDQSCLMNLRKYDARLAKDMTTIFSLGRKVANDVSPTFLRTCYETCQQYHDPDCQFEKYPTWMLSAKGLMQETTPSLRSVRVIDTQKLKLVYLPDGAEFVALSYTWSTAPSVTLLRSTEGSLFQKIEMHELPPTFRDSMQVVRWIGERYLWVDRLCIIQDSAEDKRIQLAQMDQIYLKATLTIVAAGSGADGTDNGLPGVRKGTREIQQATATIRQHIQLTHTRTSALREMISNSHWSARAWTYQEDAMSKRQLIFLPQQVVFLCQQDTFTEDFVYRSCLHGSKKQVKARSQNDERLACCRYQRPTSPALDSYVPTMESHLGYFFLVKDYTARQLTVLTDSLHAINGLLRIMTRETGEIFLCGLPVRYLVTEWLSWRPVGYSKRRHRVAFGTERSDNDSFFLPSWSWAGWIGHVTYNGHNYDFPWEESLDRSCEPLVAGEYTVLLPEKQESNQGEAFPVIELLPEETDEEVLSITHPHIDPCSLQLSRLRFSAPVAVVQLAPTLWGALDFKDPPVNEPADFTSYAHQVFIDSSFAGIVLPHIPPTTSASELYSQTLDFREYLRSQHSESDRFRQVELIALSETSYVWPMFYPYTPDDARACQNRIYVDTEGAWQDHVPFDHEVWKGEKEGGKVVNVLMIEWDDIGGCRVARRTGVGQVHRDAWEMIESKMTEIVLG